MADEELSLQELWVIFSPCLDRLASETAARPSWCLERVAAMKCGAGIPSATTILYIWFVTRGASVFL